jgi:cellulose synthase operon protein C
LRFTEDLDCAALAGRAQSQLSKGRLDAAEADFLRVHAADPLHRETWLGRLEVARKRKDAAACRLLADEALAVLPGDQGIAEAAGRSLIDLERFDEAAVLLDAAIQRQACPKDSLVLAHAAALRRAGDHESARRLHDELLGRNPNSIATWLSLVRGLIAQGEIGDALAQCEAGLAQNPNALRLRRLHADALRRSGRRGEGIEILEDLRRKRPADHGIGLALAAMLREAGRLDAAEGLYRALLAEAPDSHAALDGCVALADARGDRVSAMALLDKALSSRPAQPAWILQMATFVLKSNGIPLARTWLDRLSGSVTGLDDDQLATLMKLADRVQRPDLVAAVIRHVGARDDPIRPELARAILRSAHQVGDEALQQQMELELAERVVAPMREAFRVRAARLFRGPVEALALLREISGPFRTPAQAAGLGVALSEAGRSKLAVRYLRLCHRRWPDTPSLRRRLMQAYLRSGQPEEARSWLDTLDGGSDPAEIDGLRQLLAMETGQLTEATQLIRTEIANGKRMAGDLTLLRVLLALGRLEDAEAEAIAIKTGSGQSRKLASQFGITHLGALVSELRLYEDQRRRHPGKAPPAELVRTHYFAAKEVIDAWQTVHPWDARPAAPSTVPRRIVQYWNRTEVPASIRAIMESWRKVPGWHYTLFDRGSALRWLRDTYGAEHVRAFKLANHVAEESDFLRLCLLLADGGIYADADDLLTGTPEALLQHGAGLVVFPAPTLSSIENNIICAPRGHPVIAKAVELSLRALLGRDNDSTWSKTGPGMLTRATALHLIENPEAALSDTHLLPRALLHRQVHPHMALPYKSTSQYWNAQTGEVSLAVRAALMEVVEDSDANQSH